MYKVAQIDFENIDLQGEAIKEVTFQTHDAKTEMNLLLLAPPKKEPETVPRRTPSKVFDKLVADVTTRMKDKVYDLLTLFDDDLRLEILTSSYCVILQQRRNFPSSEETDSRDTEGIAEEPRSDRYFLLYNTREENEASLEFTKMESLLRPLLSGGEMGAEESLLKDIISSNGPILLEDLPSVLVKWNTVKPPAFQSMAGCININTKYEGGRTALHIACQNGHNDIVKQLLEMSADTRITDDNWCTPYHTAVSYGYLECLQELLQADKNRLGQEGLAEVLSLQNSEGHSVLMMAAIYNHLQCAMLLLLNEVDSNACNKLNGNAALHIAAKKGYLLICKLLAVFDANIDLKNHEGKSPLDVLEEMDDDQSKQCFQMLGALEVSEETTSWKEPVEKDSCDMQGPVLLSIDGGGIRGLLGVTVLNELEGILRQKDPNFTCLADYFQWVAGTSTGSYIVGAMAYLRVPPRKMRALYLVFKEKARLMGRPYPNEPVNQYMKDVFSEEKLLSEVKEPKVIITTTLADRNPPELHLMCNYGEPRQGQKGPGERKLWEAMRASSAAPTYFAAFDKFLDGGVMANNPTLDAMTEMVQQMKATNQPIKFGLVVSLGTGVLLSKATPGINIRKSPAAILDDLKGLVGLFQILIAQITASDGQEVERAQAWCDSVNCPLFRFSAPICDVELNDIDNERVIEMMFYGLIYAKRNRGTLQQLADLLICHRKEYKAN